MARTPKWIRKLKRQTDRARRAMDQAPFPLGNTIRLNPRQWLAFQQALAAPPWPMPRLAKLLAEPGFFEIEQADPT